HAAAPKRPPYHLKTVFACPLLFCDKKFLQVGLSCSNFTGSRTMRQSCGLATWPPRLPPPIWFVHSFRHAERKRENVSERTGSYAGALRPQKRYPSKPAQSFEPIR